MSKDDRHWKDGKPYYCVACGLGWGEFIACEEVDCELESEVEAQKRAAEPDDCDAIPDPAGGFVLNR
jgi:hypothetical protein